MYRPLTFLRSLGGAHDTDLDTQRRLKGTGPEYVHRLLELRKAVELKTSMRVREKIESLFSLPLSPIVHEIINPYAARIPEFYLFPRG